MSLLSKCLCKVPVPHLGHPSLKAPEVCWVGKLQLERCACVRNLAIDEDLSHQCTDEMNP